MVRSVISKKEPSSALFRILSLAFPLRIKLLQVLLHEAMPLLRELPRVGCVHKLLQLQELLVEVINRGIIAPRDTPPPSSARAP